MLRGNVEEQCKKISPDTIGSKSECVFAPRGGVIGFIDTSSARNGSRGIAFLGDRMYVNTDGTVREIEYQNINSLQIISSFEDSFADELSVSGMGFELRISDYSLDKFELKRLLDELCKEREEVAERRAEQAEKYAETIAQRLAENIGFPEDGENAGGFGDSAIAETLIDIPESRSPLPQNYTPAPLPDEKINWISGKSYEVRSDFDMSSKISEPPKQPEIMSGVVDRVPVIGTVKPPDPKRLQSARTALEQTEFVPEKQSERETERNIRAETATEQSKDPLKAFENDTQPSEKEMRERIENMSADEMMIFLSGTLNEINDRSSPFFDQTEEPKAEYSMTAASDSAHSDVLTVSAETQNPPQTNSVFINDAAEHQVQSAKPGKWETLTKEPVWGDIYIKASKSLRELCESGKLTMEQMENEIKARLLSTAEEFEKITDDESRVPKVLIPKITELRSAAADFDKYFAYGEDVAVRAMFFMLFQMLTYADRITESDETKDRLNDFFRRFGPAGITLSMLDMRV